MRTGPSPIPVSGIPGLEEPAMTQPASTDAGRRDALAPYPNPVEDTLAPNSPAALARDVRLPSAGADDHSRTSDDWMR